MSTLRASSRLDEEAGSREPADKFRLSHYLVQLAGMAVFFGIGILVSPPLWLLHKAAGKQIPASVGQNILRGLFRFFTWWMRATGMLRIEIRGMEALRQMRGTIFVANHPALVDAVFLVAQLPPTACVMRANLLRNPAMCGAALLARYVTNDSGPAFVRQGIEKIRSGGNLLVFPEGTRTVTAPLNSFKDGFALVATRTGAAVQTVMIRYGGSLLTKGVSLFSPVEHPLQFEIRTGELFCPEPGESAHVFSGRVESWFRAELKKTAHS